MLEIQRAVEAARHAVVVAGRAERYGQFDEETLDQLIHSAESELAQVVDRSLEC